MAQKNFDWDEEFTELFRKFCADRGLVEKNLAAAGAMHLIMMDSKSRDACMYLYNKWLESDQEMRTLLKERLFTRDMMGHVVSALTDWQEQNDEDNLRVYSEEIEDKPLTPASGDPASGAASPRGDAEAAVDKAKARSARQPGSSKKKDHAQTPPKPT